MDTSKVASPAPSLISNQQNENQQLQTSASVNSTTSTNNTSAIAPGNLTGTASGLSEVDQTDLIHIVKILQKYNFKVIINIKKLFLFI